MSELAMRLRGRQGLDPAMTCGAVALAVASGVAYQRMEDSWAAFPLFLLPLVPCVALFALALAPSNGVPAPGTEEAAAIERWQSALLAVAHLLLFGTLVNLVRVLGDDDPGTATATWTLFVSGAAAFYFSESLDSAGLRLLGLLFFATAGLTLVDWIDSEASEVAYRDMLIAEGIGFLFLARLLRPTRLEHSHVTVTVAALTLIAAATIGALGDLSFASLLGFSDFSEAPGGENGWELVLLVASIGALVYAGWQRYRGSVYPGVAGLAAFFAIAEEGTLAGWPLILLGLAIASLGWAIYGESDGGAEEPPEPPETRP